MLPCFASNWQPLLCHAPHTLITMATAAQAFSWGPGGFWSVLVTEHKALSEQHRTIQCAEPLLGATKGPRISLPVLRKRVSAHSPRHLTLIARKTAHSLTENTWSCKLKKQNSQLFKKMQSSTKKKIQIQLLFIFAYSSNIVHCALFSKD